MGNIIRDCFRLTLKRYKRKLSTTLVTHAEKRSILHSFFSAQYLCCYCTCDYQHSRCSSYIIIIFKTQKLYNLEELNDDYEALQEANQRSSSFSLHKWFPIFKDSPTNNSSGFQNCLRRQKISWTMKQRCRTESIFWCRLFREASWCFTERTVQALVWVRVYLSLIILNLNYSALSSKAIIPQVCQMKTKSYIKCLSLQCWLYNSSLYLCLTLSCINT